MITQSCSDTSLSRPLDHHHRRIIRRLLSSQMPPPIGEKGVEDSAGGGTRCAAQHREGPFITVLLLPRVTAFEEAVRAEDQGAAGSQMEAVVAVDSRRTLAEREARSHP